jgi:hypothetical protein
MKSIISMLLLTCGMAMTVPCLGQDTTAAEVYEALEISGNISAEDEGIEGAMVELFEGNRVVDAYETKKNGKFKFTLYNDLIYTIQITKKGYYTKRISVNTKLPADYDDFAKFQFDITMVSKETEQYDPYLAEYPSALISFDPKKKEFNYDKNYTKTYFDEVKVEEK